MSNKGVPIAQIRAEGEKKRQSILNCRAYRGGDRFDANEAARVLRCERKAAYDVLTRMVRDGVLQSHRQGNGVVFSKPGVDWLKVSWRLRSDEELEINALLLDESLGSL